MVSQVADNYLDDVRRKILFNHFEDDTVVPNPIKGLFGIEKGPPVVSLLLIPLSTRYGKKDNDCMLPGSREISFHKASIVGFRQECNCFNRKRPQFYVLNLVFSGGFSILQCQNDLAHLSRGDE
ncbi:hypothetical protein TNCV_3447441 [Trichonephila clavipes]|nr:hypothetical protein TNCV_3447441 [Trichonephila clavipes]